MIDEAHEERAALYALGLLDLDEATAFEQEAAADGELRVLADELREAVASLARTETNVAPPAELKGRVLARFEEEKRGRLTAGKVIAGPWTRWGSWAAVAVLLVFCGALTWGLLDQQARYRKAVGTAATTLQKSRAMEDELRDEQAGRLRQVAFCTLSPVPAARQTGPQAAVLWDAAQRQGRLRLSKLPPPAQGKDYQLWAVEDGHKDPVSAGIIKVGLDGDAEIDFQPQSDDGKAAVVAFALSLERAGGAPKNEGPILYLGKL